MMTNENNYLATAENNVTGLLSVFNHLFSFLFNTWVSFYISNNLLLLPTMRNDYVYDLKSSEKTTDVSPAVLANE